MATPLLATPERSQETDWRVPRPSDRFERILTKVPKNGEWFVVRKGSGFTVSEQQARTLNTSADFSGWEWGHRVYAANGELVSDLAVRWAGVR